MAQTHATPQLPAVEDGKVEVMSNKKELPKGEGEEQTFPPFRTVVIVMASLYLAMFLVALVGIPDSDMQETKTKSLTFYFRTG
jgi:hypothetical protein